MKKFLFHSPNGSSDNLTENAAHRPSKNKCIENPSIYEYWYYLPEPDVNKAQAIACSSLHYGSGNDAEITGSTCYTPPTIGLSNAYSPFNTPNRNAYVTGNIIANEITTSEVGATKSEYVPVYNNNNIRVSPYNCVSRDHAYSPWVENTMASTMSSVGRVEPISEYLNGRRTAEICQSAGNKYDSAYNAMNLSSPLSIENTEPAIKQYPYGSQNSSVSVNDCNDMRTIVTEGRGSGDAYSHVTPLPNEPLLVEQHFDNDSEQIWYPPSSICNNNEMSYSSIHGADVASNSTNSNINRRLPIVKAATQSSENLCLVLNNKDPLAMDADKVNVCPSMYNNNQTSKGANINDISAALASTSLRPKKPNVCPHRNHFRALRVPPGKSLGDWVKIARECTIKNRMSANRTALGPCTAKKRKFGQQPCSVRLMVQPNMRSNLLNVVCSLRNEIPVNMFAADSTNILKLKSHEATLIYARYTAVIRVATEYIKQLKKQIETLENGKQSRLAIS